ncbi:hypothetical protein X975_08441, partial [Stegodyphus mimosarum]
MNGLDMDLFLISDEVWFYPSGYVNSQNRRLSAARILQITLHDQKVGVWCTVSARRIIGLIFYYQMLNLERCISTIFNPFMATLTKEEMTYSYFQ